MKTFFWFALLTFSIHLSAQDSITKGKLPIGIYLKEKEFLERKPSITKPFKVIPYADTSYNETENKYDTTQLGVLFQYLDSTKPKNAFGFFDGKDMYWGDRKNGYYAFDYIGKFSFIQAPEPKYSNNWLGPALSVLTFAARGGTGVPILYWGRYTNRNSVLLFYTKAGKLHQATSQSIYWLIKDDKDFLEEWHAEKKYNYEVFKKYLMKMNERYPES